MIHCIPVSRASRFALTLALLLLMAAPLVAAAPQAQHDALAGYAEVLPGVWEKALPDGAVHRLASGPEGLTWALTELHATSADLVTAYLADPSDELWARIQGVASTIDRIRQDVEKVRSADAAGQVRAYLEAAQSCGSYGYSTSATAGPLNTGATASASSSWWNSCGLVGDCYSYAYARANGLSQSYSCYDDGTSCNCSSSASKAGTSSCSSNSNSYVYVSALSLYDSKSATNNDCGVANLVVSLSCVDPGYPQHDCTGTASGGVTPYRAYWKVDSYPEYESFGSPGTGPWSLSLVCKHHLGQTATVRLRVVDSAGTQRTRTWHCGAALE